MSSIRALLKLAYGQGVLTLDQANELYSRLVFVLFGAIGLILLGIASNLAGFGWICLPLSLVFGLVTAVVWLEPARVALIAITGAVAGGMASGNSNGAKSTAVLFVKIYVDLLGKVLLWGTIVLFVLGVMPFKGHGEVLFVLIPGIIVLALMSWQWKKPFAWLVGAAVIVLWLGWLAYAGNLMMPEEWLAHAPSFTSVGDWGWGHWLGLLMFGGALVFAIEHFWGEATRKKATPVVLGILALFLVVPTLVASPPARWVAENVLGISSYARPSCADFSASAWHTCVLNESWSHPIGVDQPTAENEFFRCVNAPDLGNLSVQHVGPNLVEYRTLHGSVETRYKLESSDSCEEAPAT